MIFSFTGNTGNKRKRKRKKKINTRSQHSPSDSYRNLLLKFFVMFFAIFQCTPRSKKTRQEILSSKLFYIMWHYKTARCALSEAEGGSLIITLCTDGLRQIAALHHTPPLTNSISRFWF